MRRFGLVLVTALAALAVACGAKKKEEKKPAPGSFDATGDAPGELADPVAAHFGDADVQLKYVRVTLGWNYTTNSTNDFRKTGYSDQLEIALSDNAGSIPCGQMTVPKETRISHNITLKVPKVAATYAYDQSLRSAGKIGCNSNFQNEIYKSMGSGKAMIDGNFITGKGSLALTVTAGGGVHGDLDLAGEPNAPVMTGQAKLDSDPAHYEASGSFDGVICDPGFDHTESLPMACPLKK